jgi:GGDEF domain-containing protein
MTKRLDPETALEIFDALPVPTLVLAKDGAVRAANAALLRLLGTGPSTGNPLDHRGGSLVTAEEDTTVEWTTPDGSKRQLLVERAYAGDSEVRYFIDVTEQLELERERDQLQEKLKSHALTDAVTGLLNERGLILALEPQVARSRRYNSPIAVVMLEARAEREQDRFRIEVAHLLKDQLRWADLIGCTDDDDFLIALPETTEGDANMLAEKLSGRIRKLAGNHPGQTSQCHGVTAWRKGDNAATLMRRAAGALRQARIERGDMAAAS